MNKPKIFVAGHNGMVGSAILDILKKKNVTLLIRSKRELDLVDQKAVFTFLKKEKPDQIYIAAARAGGIYANSHYPAEFIYTNLMIQSNIIHSAFLNKIKKLLFLGSSCIYPKYANQPMEEKELLSGYLEKTNEPYAVAKIAGIKMCESYNRQYGEKFELDYRCIMPTNLYGPGDNFHPKNSHVIPSLIRKFYEAKINKKPIVKVWGTGSPKREFLFVKDLAKACVKIMSINKKKYNKLINKHLSHINVGSGSDLTILELAEKIKKIVGYEGKIKFDKTQPDGMPQKLLDSKKITSIGWRPEVSLDRGLLQTYKYFRKKNSENNQKNI